MLQDLTTCLSPQRADEPRVVFKTPSEGNKTIAIDTARRKESGSAHPSAKSNKKKKLCDPLRIQSFCAFS